MKNQKKKAEDSFWGHIRCWLTKRTKFDFHTEKDGLDPNAEPMHFYEYECRHCGKKFFI